MSPRKTFFVLWPLLAVFLFVVLNVESITEGGFTDRYRGLVSGNPGTMTGAALALIVVYVLPSAVLAGLAALGVKLSRR